MHFKGSAGPRAAPAESLYCICYFRYDSKGILCKTWPKSTVTLKRPINVSELVSESSVFENGITSSPRSFQRGVIVIFPLKGTLDTQYKCRIYEYM